MAIEIVDLPINSMVIFNSKLLVYQRVKLRNDVRTALSPWRTPPSSLDQVYKARLRSSDQQPGVLANPR